MKLQPTWRLLPVVCNLNQARFLTVYVIKLKIWHEVGKKKFFLFYILSQKKIARIRKQTKNLCRLHISNWTPLVNRHRHRYIKPSIWLHIWNSWPLNSIPYLRLSQWNLSKHFDIMIVFNKKRCVVFCNLFINLYNKLMSYANSVHCYF